jgi:hypothetical protein
MPQLKAVASSCPAKVAISWRVPGMRRIFTLFACVVATACGAHAENGAPVELPGYVTYRLVSVNGHGLPFTDPQTSLRWTGGQWIVTAEKTFSATFNVSPGNIPRTLTKTGVFEPGDSVSMTIVYSDGTRQIAVLTAGGFRARLGSLTMGLSRF